MNDSSNAPAFFPLKKKPLLLLLAGASIAWLLILSQLMIADVWDETNGRLILAIEPVASAGFWKAMQLVWLHQLPLDIYRPLGSSLFIVLSKIFHGNFVVLRYINALFVLGSAWCFALVLLRKYNTSAPRVLMFFLVFLFSSAAVMTAGWSANIFDASCLFFIALATWLLSRQAFYSCAMALLAATFCKETYVLFLPLFVQLIGQDKTVTWRNLVIPASLVLAGTVFYWIARQRLVPIGSAADIHGFDPGAYLLSLLSFAGGFVYQFSKFTIASPTLWLGLLALLALVAALKDTWSRLTLTSLLLASSLIYWGMFSFQGDSVVTQHNFVGRLYVVPFALCLFLLVRHVEFRILVMVAGLGVWGLLWTFRDYRVFQHTYAEIYTLAEDAPGQLLVHYPEKPLADFQRNILIGDFPDAPLHIDVRHGGVAHLAD